MILYKIKHLKYFFSKEQGIWKAICFEDDSKKSFERI